MNNDVILEMVKPYVKGNVLTYDDFDEIFNFLKLKEQYKVIEVLDSNNIELSESYPEAAAEEKSASPSPVNEPREEVLLYKNIHQSNEILCSLIREGNAQAKQDLCVKNQRLVYKFVKPYFKYMGNKLDEEDILQAGMMGLLKAAYHFDPAKNDHFATYAVFWIRQAAAREVMDNGFTIRVPVHMMEKISKVTREDASLAWKIRDYKDRIRQIAVNLDMSEDKVEEALMVRSAFLGTASLDMPVGEKDETELIDFIPDQKGETLEQEVDISDRNQQLKELLKTLKDKERQVLIYRFGLEDGHDRTLEEVGMIFGVTRERIRQIEKKAIEKLQKQIKSKGLEIVFME